MPKISEYSEKILPVGTDLVIVETADGYTKKEQLINIMSRSDILPPVHANNTAAVGAGLTSGMRYRTGADPDVLCVVH